MSDPVRWYKLDGKGFTIDVKVERMPGYQWSWRLVKDAAFRLIGLGTKMLEDRHAEYLEKTGRSEI